MANRLHRNESAAKRLRHIVRKYIRLASEAIESVIAVDSALNGEAIDRDAAVRDAAEHDGVNGDAAADTSVDEALHAASPDKAVHVARQQLKKARAGLRLMRVALGKQRYERENLALRDAARPLTELRDARVLADEFAALEAGDAAGLAPELLAGIDRFLIERRSALRQPAPQAIGAEHSLGARLEPALQALRAAHQRAGRWPLDAHCWPALVHGIERVYRAGRSALAQARRNPSVDQLHEWRKQAKYLRYQLEALQPARPKLLRRLTRQARQIGDYLGDNHDLALLADIAGGHFAAAPDAGRLLAIIDHRRDQLANQAVTIGMILYRRRPKAFVDRLRKPWHAGRDG